jgi:transposase InsO family protein
VDSEIRSRLEWVTLFERTGNQGLVCRRCGISRPTLRKWVKRYRELGRDGLVNITRRPKRSPGQKVTATVEDWIKELRGRRLGSRRIQSELARVHEVSLARATIHKVLGRISATPLERKRLNRRKRNRYDAKVPGERVQMDTCKVASGLIQYTAVDDCTRVRVLAVYKRRTAANSLLFLERVIEEMPFPIQRIQTDRGREFFAYAFQEKLIEYGIKFRPIRPASPHLNGKVERSQRTDLEEFYATVNVKSADFPAQLEAWQDFYNQYRAHGSLSGRTPWETWNALTSITPYGDEVEAMYDASVERIRCQAYRLDQRWADVDRRRRPSR